ncbi:phage tail protein [Nonomuraea sp. B12E4]|uniref:phage tail protein n=1 Tax=Nonomuraea sp. B12E4 TaxID=3153564 RepID=UPI00325C3E5D
MAVFKVGGVGRYDPYKSFMFRVRWDLTYVAGVSKMSALRRTTTAVRHRNGADPSRDRKSPGVTRYEAVTLQRGITLDTRFEEWASLVHAPGSPIALSRLRKDLIVDVFNEGGQQVLSYRLNRCWVSEFQTLPQLDAAGAAVAIEMLKVELEGWERDTPHVVHAGM